MTLARRIVQLASHRSRQWIPLVGSVLVLAILLCQISPAQVWHAFGRLNWAVLGPATVLLVVLMYLWDSLCLWWLFHRHDRDLRYLTVLRVRGASYLFTVINYGLGHGMLAWLLSRVSGTRFLPTAVRCFLVTYVDLMVLLALGLMGATLSSDPRTDPIAWFCGLTLGGLLVLNAAIRFLPRRLAGRIGQTRWGQALQSPDWRLRPLVLLGLARAVYACHGIVYVAVCLAACGLPLDPKVVLSVIPIIVLVDALPISLSGLGTREAVLLVLLRPDQPELLLAFSLVWWALELTGRGLIGLVNVWLNVLMRKR